MCGGSDPVAPTPPPPPAPPPVPTADVDLEGVQKKNKRQAQIVKRRGASAPRRDLKINSPTTGAGLNTGGGQ